MLSSLAPLPKSTACVQVPRTPACDDGDAISAGVREAPRHEVAGSWAPFGAARSMAIVGGRRAGSSVIGRAFGSVRSQPVRSGARRYHQNAR